MISPLDHHLLRAYLDGEMDAETAQAFEVRMIERPELAEFVDADSALGIGLRAGEKPASSGATVVALPAAPAAPPVRRAARVVPFLAAAAVLLAVGVGVGRLQQPPRPDAAALVPATIVNIGAMRSAEPDARKFRVPATGSVILAVPVATGDKCPAHVRISQGNVVLTTDATLDHERFANVVTDASLLSPGQAVIEASCIGQQPDRYTVEFVR